MKGPCLRLNFAADLRFLKRYTHSFKLQFGPGRFNRNWIVKNLGVHKLC